jgi:TetR/AcrR family transcriptional regulator
MARDPGVAVPPLPPLVFDPPAEHRAPDPGALGPRAARTRAQIVDATRVLFLERGYAATRISDITAACGISRAGFYTYFKDKRDVFVLLTAAAYQQVQRGVAAWDELAGPVTAADVGGWVRTYFACMDVHGAFLHAVGRSAPEDDRFRSTERRLRMRAAFQLGMRLRARQARPTPTPEALGLVVLAMLDRCWHASRVMRLPVDDGDVVRTTATVVHSFLTAGPLPRPAPASGPVDPPLSPRDPVLDAARRVFVERGYADPTEAELVAACGIGRAGFRARFGGKRELFLATGIAALQDALHTVAGWEEVPRPCSRADVEGWVRGWLATMDRHGAFVFLAALAAVAGPEFHAQATSSLMQVAWSLGGRLRARQAEPTSAPDALGLAVLGMVSDTWFHCRRQRLPVADADLVAVLATALVDLLGAPVRTGADAG